MVVRCLSVAVGWLSMRVVSCCWMPCCSTLIAFRRRGDGWSGLEREPCAHVSVVEPTHRLTVAEIRG
jgi:hypothetical protein